ncbi:hypothetical protein NSP_29510 [Nodularia spumigena CCY9414]|nr:hypothetical protein NSP_29510 [Nodularia spumigena CCY9414]
MTIAIKNSAAKVPFQMQIRTLPESKNFRRTFMILTIQ